MESKVQERKSNEVEVEDQKFKSEGEKYFEGCEKLVINNDEDLKFADDFVSHGYEKMKAIVAWFKPMKDSAWKAHKEICGREKSAVEFYDEGSKNLSRRISAYKAEQERKRIAALKRQAEAERKKREKEAAELQKAGYTEPEAKEIAQSMPMPTKKFFAPAVKTRVSGVKKWRAVVINEDKIPRRYLVHDQSALNKAANAAKGQIEIPGCRIEEYEETRRR